MYLTDYQSFSQNRTKNFFDKAKQCTRGLLVSHLRNIGETANSQVCVMACLSNGDYASVIDTQPYLPKDWIDDPDHSQKAGIPGAKHGT